MTKAKAKIKPFHTAGVNVKSFDKKYLVVIPAGVFFPYEEHGQPKHFGAGDEFNGLEWPKPEITIPDAINDGWIVEAEHVVPIVEEAQ